MGKSNYWTIWCPISQFVEHFDFLAHIYILLLQNKARDNKSLNAGIQQAQNYQLTFQNSHNIKALKTNVHKLQQEIHFYKHKIV